MLMLIYKEKNRFTTIFVCVLESYLLYVGLRVQLYLKINCFHKLKNTPFISIEYLITNT